MKKQLTKIKEIINVNSIKSEELKKYFTHTGKFIEFLYELEENLNEEYFNDKSLEELKELNRSLYNEVSKENYKTSYANPTYAVEALGEGVGQALSYLYYLIRESIPHIFRHNVNKLNIAGEMFIKLYKAITQGEISYKIVKEAINNVTLETLKENVREINFLNNLKRDSYYLDIINNSDLTDLRYLYKSGLYVSENEIKTAEFLNKYDEEKLNTLSKATVDAYINGFTRENKDIKLRTNVSIIYSLGQERLIKGVLREIKSHNLEVIIEEVETTEYNKQYGYDHRFDSALYMSKDYVEKRTEELKVFAQEVEEKLRDYSGILVVEKFGQNPVSPDSKKECLKFSDEQNRIFTEYKNFLRQFYETYMPEKDTSFCIIAFPSPEIGENFEEIFEDTCKINMLDSNKYEVIQQKIIDALDKGEIVHVKGCGTNKTDIKVRLNELKNPEKETNFVNCVADVNVPVGEVFTSPVLKGTNGTLHLEETFLGVKYDNLELIFKDGYISEYTCTNFEDEEENKKYIEENLMFPHKTLPLGEFAIGTNTLAYVVCKKYGIIDKLPVLIIEKMGPHFAVGDTCFSFAEDIPVCNPLDKKEIIARDNEKSILRKTDINEAYTNVHTDITLPYDGLECVTVITKEGENIDIIKNGRFVLEGTEELNEVFE